MTLHNRSLKRNIRVVYEEHPALPLCLGTEIQSAITVKVLVEDKFHVNIKRQAVTAVLTGYGTPNALFAMAQGDIAVEQSVNHALGPAGKELAVHHVMGQVSKRPNAGYAKGAANLRVKQCKIIL